MNKVEILKQAKFQVTPTRGITMEESIQLSMLPRLDINTSALNEAEIVGQVKRVIEKELNRSNITAKDMRNAVVGLLRW